MEYGEATAIRRSTRLVYDAGRMNFSVLNFMVIIFTIALIVAGVGSIFKG